MIVGELKIGDKLPPGKVFSIEELDNYRKLTIELNNGICYTTLLTKDLSVSEAHGGGRVDQKWRQG